MLDASDADLLKEVPEEQGEAVDLKKLEEMDDLEELKQDVGELLGDTPTEKTDEAKKKLKKEKIEVEKEKVGGDTKGPIIFDVGEEEKELLRLSKFVESKIPSKEWNEISAAAKIDKYVVQKGDWLWKICKKLFGSGFYYSKIWALNPFITNPHEITPGMNLIFDTGDAESLPKIELGEFAEIYQGKAGRIGKGGFSLEQFGEATEPPWLKERKKLIDQGIYFQYASEETYDDLVEIGKRSLYKEYEKYEPPHTPITITEPGEQYDETGFDKSSKLIFDFKEGFFLNTFITTNIVQDFGVLDAIPSENVFVHQFSNVYVKFDSNLKVRPGDKFSVYTADGKVSHPVSDRSGYRYTIVAQIEAVRKINHVWECKVFELTGIVQRKDRITVYTPKINKIIKTFNQRSVEAAIIASYRDSQGGLSFGDVVYLDRGRADGVELGNVFEIFSFYDRGTEKKITLDPTYKIGEVTVITLSDNFSTALISYSSSEIMVGNIALSKTAESAARATRVKNQELLKGIKALETEALDELDIELNLDDIGEGLLDKVDKVRLTEDELEELERQEREKSIIKDHERDLRELERLESEIVEAEASLKQGQIDEDKFLEQQNLEEIEKKRKEFDPNAFESLEEIEKEIGIKYLDEDLNAKENPYGLTEFDLEEVDELLNTDKSSK